MATTNNCNCCFTDFVVKCETHIRVNSKLDPETEYIWVITDKFGRQYQGEFLTNNDGGFSIPVAELPAGMLTEYSGEFKIEVFVNEESCSPVKFLMQQEVDCINFSVHAGTRVKDWIGCQYP